MSEKQLDIQALRDRLAGEDGLQYWRSLDEVAQTEAFQDFARHEFPEGVDEWTDAQSRRRFLKIMAASLAMGGLAACSQPGEKIVPYVEEPEQSVPGIPQFFATAFLLGGYAQGVLVESHAGRPTKIEGNPDHPASLGATNVFAQGSILDLYDPDRSENVRYRGTISTGTDFAQAMSTERGRLGRGGGAGLRILTGTVTSPTLSGQMEALLEEFPQARWHAHDPVGGGQGQRDTRPLYHFDRAEVIFSIDTDFLLTLPGSVRYAHDFAERRRVREGEARMNRLYMAESAPTITGTMADHRLPRRPSRIRRLVQAVAGRLGIAGEAPGEPSDLSEEERRWLDALVSDLQEHRGSALVVADRTQPPPVRALARAMNRQLGEGETVEYIPSVEAQPSGPRHSLQALTEDMRAGRVETLVILGGNPAYTAPADVSFAEALSRVDTSVHLSLHVDETSQRCTWHVPRAHYLETWSDARAFDGTATIMQPLIAPLYAGCHSAHEVLSALQGEAGRSSHDLVSGYWQGRRGGAGAGSFSAFWEQALYRGVVPGTGRLEAAPQGAVPGLVEREGGGSSIEDRESRIDNRAAGPADTLQTQAQSSILDPQSSDTVETRTAVQDAPMRGEEQALEVIFRPDPSLWDGRFANNGWMQELPKPITKLSWDNAALMSPATAEHWGIKPDHISRETEPVVELQYRGRSVRAAVWVVPGHADGCVTVYLGHGRRQAGRIGDGVGFDAYRLRSSDALWSGRGLEVEPTGETYNLVSTQDHYSMEGRELVIEAPIEKFRENSDFVKEGRPMELPTLYPDYEYDGYKWGMVIDQNTCIGCNACIVACQSENNIPIVGKSEVKNGREMHWLRVDRYYKGTFENPDTYWQPVPCMHCENAPCEYVCPVYATVHDDEGLNVMVYNRCIGTRYCSNNCPYKVRRFNFLEYSDWGPENRAGLGETEADRPEVTKMQHNPDVTVRSRGVMEKCTYCIQRISAARIDAKKEEREIRDGEILTACQQACPTEAIVFGDLNDETAEVHHLREQPHEYALLEELGTRPRTTYLAHFHNPNSELEEPEQHDIRQRGLSPEIGKEG